MRTLRALRLFGGFACAFLLSFAVHSSVFATVLPVPCWRSALPTAAAPIYVDPATGVDDANRGCSTKPYKTVGFAMTDQVAMYQAEFGNVEPPVTWVYDIRYKPKTTVFTESFSYTGPLTFRVRPYTDGQNTKTLFSFSGDDVRFQYFNFQASAGIRVNGAAQSIWIQNNTFGPSSVLTATSNAELSTVTDNTFNSASLTLQNLGASYFLDNAFSNTAFTLSGVTADVHVSDNFFSSSNVTVRDSVDASFFGNTFSDSSLFVKDQRVGLIFNSNHFSGTPFVSAYGSWFVVIEGNTGAVVDFRDNTLIGGAGIFVKDSEHVKVVGNSITGTGVSTQIGLAMNNAAADDISNNTITAVGDGIFVANSAPLNFGPISYNTVTSTNGAASEDFGIYLNDVVSDTVSHNAVANADIAVALVDCEVDLVEQNLLTGDEEDLQVRLGHIGSILGNQFGAEGIGIHGFDHAVIDLIQNNFFWRGYEGIILEGDWNEFALWQGEGELPQEQGPGTRMQSGTDIIDNNFLDLTTGIGLASVEIGLVTGNHFDHDENGLLAVNASIESFDKNDLNAAPAVASRGVQLYGSLLVSMFSNHFDAFDTSVELDAGSLVMSLSGNTFSGGDYALYVDGGEVALPINNSVFMKNGYGIFVVPSTSPALGIVNNTFVEPTVAALSLGAPSSLNYEVANNVFSSSTGLPVALVDRVSDVGTFDYNLYDQGGLGATRAVVSGTSYDFTELKDLLGWETQGYEDSGDVFNNPGLLDFSLKAGSLGMNSADMSFPLFQDLFGTGRPYCDFSDRGAVEYTTGANAVDFDVDGLCDYQETAWGSDDTLSDTDADGLSDRDEIYVYSTKVSVADSDGDGFSDGGEVLTDFTDPLDATSHGLDADYDGMPDNWEILYGLDLADSADAVLDGDNDGLTNLEEYTAGTDPTLGDVDGDLLLDGDELIAGTDPAVADTDADGYDDGEEVIAGTDPLVSTSHPNDTDRDGMDDTWESGYGLDPADATDAALDSDNDGLTNLEEYREGTSPVEADVDGDLLLDGEEVALGTDPAVADTDADGLPDGYEVEYTLDPLTVDSGEDLDGDGLTNLQEYGFSSYPNDADTDADGLPDAYEVQYGLELLVNDAALDLDVDGLSNEEEYVLGTYPNIEDTDGDGFSDGVEVTAGTLPTDATNYPSDGDFDGLSDDWELLYSCVDSSVADASDDDDLDGLSHLEENVLGTHPCISDTDGDGLSDGTEVITSGTDPLEADVDGDTLNDSVELTYGTDPNSSDTDSDGLSDSDEIYVYFTEPTLSDTDGDGLGDGAELSDGTDPVISDTDTDGLTDGDEVNTYGTDPLLMDSDGDGFSDYAEVITYGTDANDSADYPRDADGDGLSDDWEVLHSCVDTSASDASGNTDLDGLTNLQEYVLGTDPCLADTDTDGLTDGDEINTYGTDPLEVDTDVDGLNDGEESAYGTDPSLADTDVDGLLDGDEVNTIGTDPLNADSDADELTDDDEVNTYGTNPLNEDSDGDGFSDGLEVDGGWLPLDPSSHPAIVDTDSDRLYDVDETNGTYGYITDPYLIDTDSDTLTDYDEIFVYFTDPTTNDTDGDLFADDYELEQATLPGDSASNPSLSIRVVGYAELFGHGSSASSWLSGPLYYSPYTDYQTFNLSQDYWIEIDYSSYGAFGIAYDRDDFLGELTVTACGSMSSEFNPVASSCSSIPYYSDSSNPNSQSTEVQSESELEVWSVLSNFYTFSDWRWFRAPLATSNTYFAFKVSLP